MPWTTSAKATTAATNTIPNPIITEYSVGVLRPVRGQELAHGHRQDGREEEREGDREQPDQPADGPLDVAQDEHAEQDQDDQQVEHVQRVEELDEIQRHTPRNGPGTPAGREPRRTVAARGSGSQRPERPIRVRPGGGPPTLGSAATIPATAASTSASVRVRSGGTEPEPPGEAALALGERHAPVDVEQADVAQQRATVGAQERLDVGRRRRVGHDDREVPLDLGEAAHGRGTLGRQPAGGEALDGDLGQEHPRGGPQLPRVDEGRVELADDRVEAVAGVARARCGRGGRSPRPARARRPGAAGRGGRRAARGAPFASSRSYGRAGRFQAGGSAAPTSAMPEPPPLARLAAGAGVALADLEHRDVVRPVAQVDADDVEQAAEQVPAQHRVIARERVADRDGLAAGRRVALDRRDLARRGRTSRRGAARRARSSRPRSGRRRRGSRGPARGPRAATGGTRASPVSGVTDGTSS